MVNLDILNVVNDLERFSLYPDKIDFVEGVIKVEVPKEIYIACVLQNIRNLWKYEQIVFDGTSVWLYLTFDKVKKEKPVKSNIRISVKNWLNKWFK